jgi:hypothetical protein
MLILVWLVAAMAATAQRPASPPAAGGEAVAPARPMGRPGTLARYRHESGADLRPSVVREFTLTLGSTERRASGDWQWLRLEAAKAGGQTFRLWMLAAAYPPARNTAAYVARFLAQEGTDPAREYRHGLTGGAVLPAMGGWEHLLPRPVEGQELLAPRVRYLGHRYRREALEPASPFALPNARAVELRPDLWLGPATNQRQKDETRRFDDSDYEMVRFARADYQALAAAGATVVMADENQVAWADEAGLFYWGPCAKALPYPEMLYRSQFLGPALYFDEPAVSTRDHVLRPRLAKDEAFRQSITPQLALAAFEEYFQRALAQGAPTALMRLLAARPDADLGDMQFVQENLYTWETMADTAAYQLTRDPITPNAIVFEPPGRIGTRRTLPEMNMAYGTQIPPDDPRNLTAILFGFLRGAARLTGKEWGVSVYGQVQPADAPWWLTHAYDLGATKFFFWDNHRLACVPFGEVLALSRHLRTHAGQNPERDLARLRQAAEVAILMPPGYGLGHVFMGKGLLWGINELNLERVNRRGVKHRVVMSRVFTEIERCLRLGVAFDILWDLPGVAPQGYREVVRVAEDGQVELAGAGREAPSRAPVRPEGTPPELAVTVEASEPAAELTITARARVIERTAPVYYTLGADPAGVYHNAWVFWELHGPREEDHRFVQPPHLRPDVRRTAEGALVQVAFSVSQPGQYRLRAATVDMAGRTSVVWTPLSVVREGAALRLGPAARR